MQLVDHCGQGTKSEDENFRSYQVEGTNQTMQMLDN
jgi:hypothetical protein